MRIKFKTRPQKVYTYNPDKATAKLLKMMYKKSAQDKKDDKKFVDTLFGDYTIQLKGETNDVQSRTKKQKAGKKC